MKGVTIVYLSDEDGAKLFKTLNNEIETDIKKLKLAGAKSTEGFYVDKSGKPRSAIDG